ncbi:MAG: hypothetical protein DIZ77_09660 [endosymbiont of Seepiophila jonesi]|uniref:Glycosyltransferase 2-like domain-containing protein n=1 Tax=endosymbiont of Lamellibrachia luymesi TaxID=2200907 RepID=A0A370DZZ3_9GAMM|nr:MAG: hypothetical protein DIZ77_09660 [endosymbiont of Seepiophila jonesi]RDH92484.1 MAG: hypothetical protein DIZ79_03355 [endosymbiont of Lamellibrachia luymesi]
MKHFPKVTVITIVRNDAEGFLITARGVLQQDYSNIEWVVVDGLSTDGTADYIRQLSPQISKYKIERDNGIYDAMNKGIDMATGDWVFFMNADDVFYDSSTISDYISNLREDDEIVYSDVVRREDGRIHLYRSPEKYWCGMVFDHQTACVKADIYKKYNYDESFKVSGDLSFFSNARINRHKFRKIRWLKGCIKPFDTGASSSYYDRQKERVVVLRKYFDGPQLSAVLNAEFNSSLKSNVLNKKQHKSLLTLIR